MLFDRIQFWITYPGYSPSRFFAISDKEMKSFSKSLVYTRIVKAALWSEAKSIQEMRMKLMEKYLLPEGKERKR